MIHPEITIPRMAAILARLDGLDADGVVEGNNRLKNLARKGYFRSIEDPNATATSARRYPLIELFRARILSDAVISGLTGEAVKKASEALSGRSFAYPQAPSAKAGRGYNYTNAFDDALRGIRAGERWTLEVRCEQSPSGLQWYAAVVYSGNETDLTDFTQLAQSNGARHVSHVSFDLSEKYQALSQFLGEA